MFIAGGGWAKRLQVAGASVESPLRDDDARRRSAFSKVTLLGSTED